MFLIPILLLSLTGFAFLNGLESGLQSPDCDRPGWFPTEFGLMDHTVFWHQGYYYIVSIHLYPDDRFAYARSTDFCNWEDLSPVLEARTPGSADEMSIWAPFVYEENGTYYLFYTGVNYAFTQSILLATSNNPADPDQWQVHGVVFQPNHAGMIWENNEWADCRDPMVIWENGRYYLYYTGLDEDGNSGCDCCKYRS